VGVTRPLFGYSKRIDVVLNPHRHAEMTAKWFGKFDVLPLEQVGEVAGTTTRVNDAGKSDANSEHLGSRQPRGSYCSSHFDFNCVDGSRGISHEGNVEFLRGDDLSGQIANYRRHSIATKFDSDDETGPGIHTQEHRWTTPTRGRSRHFNKNAALEQFVDDCRNRWRAKKTLAREIRSRY
jgi:hypothetical protein